MDYQYSNMYSSENPNPSYNVVAHYANSVNACRSKSYNPCEREWGAATYALLTSYRGYSNIFNAKKQLFDNLIDGGDRQHLILQIERNWAGNSRRIKDELLRISPYLSQTLLRYLGTNRSLSSQDYLEICLANPEATVDYDFINFLQYNIPSPFSIREIQQIEATWNRFTTRGDMEKELSVVGELKDAAFDIYMHHLSTDSVNRNREVSSALFDRAYLIDIFALAERMIAQARFNEAYNLITTNHRQLTDSENADMQEFIAYCKYRIQLDQEGKTIYTLNENDIDELISFSNKHFGRAKILADNILCYLYNRCSDEPLFNERSLAITDENTSINEVEAKLSSFVKVFPNPADQYCNFEYSFDENAGSYLLQISDKVGKIILSQPLSGAQGSWRWNCKEVSSGMYFYQISKNNGIVETGKVVVK
ncbi:MAG: T9SS type A sorting domain-containing protein, partial [Bacteroidales bacterium]|jgi:hypothetical protein|nr:T9SS type A sorting domain-containing protein [Bacteroidales bacterium]